MADLPALSVEDIIKALDGVTNSQTDDVGTTKPLLECVISGVVRGAAVLLGTPESVVRSTDEYVAMIKKLLANDIVVLAIGYPVQVALDAGLIDNAAKELCGAGMKRVCELAEIPPVLPLGGLENIQNVVTIAGALSSDSGLPVPALPVVGVDAAGVSEQAVTLANTFVGLGVDTYIGTMDGTSVDGLKDGEQAKHTTDTDLDSLADKIIAGIEAKRAAAGI